MNKTQRERVHALIRSAKQLSVELEELVDSINAEAAEEDTAFTGFDVNRTTLDLRVAARLTADVARKIGQVGTWTTRKS